MNVVMTDEESSVILIQLKHKFIRLIQKIKNELLKMDCDMDKKETKKFNL